VRTDRLFRAEVSIKEVMGESMRKLSKILFAILIGLSFVAGSAIASPSSYRHRPRGPRSYKHGGKHGKHGKFVIENYSWSQENSAIVVGGGKGGGAGAGRANTGIKVKRPPKKRNLLASPPK
jgi:hypothetical protein